MGQGTHVSGLWNLNAVGSARQFGLSWAMYSSGSDSTTMSYSELGEHNDSRQKVPLPLAGGALDSNLNNKPNTFVSNLKTYFVPPLYWKLSL